MRVGAAQASVVAMPATRRRYVCQSLLGACYGLPGAGAIYTRQTA